MNITHFYRTLKSADEYEATVFEVPSGTIMTAAVTLYRVTETGLDGVEVTFHVVREGNPGLVVISTGDQATAYRVYADEIDLVKKAQSERIMWRR